MGNIWSVGVPVLLADILNPVLLAAVILALTTARPYVAAVALIGGHMVAYFAAGLMILFGLADPLVNALAPIGHRFANPQPLDYTVSLLVGALLFMVGRRWWNTPSTKTDDKPEKVDSGPVAAFSFGMLINFAGIPFALPYFAFMAELYPLATVDRLTALGLYNLLYAVPFLLIPAALAMFGTAAVMPVMEKMNRWVDAGAARLVPAILAVLGLGMMLDSVVYIGSGTGLF